MTEPGPRASAEELARRADDREHWLRVERLTRKIIGRRMEEGPTPATDRALDQLIVLRGWVARRLEN